MGTQRKPHRRNDLDVAAQEAFYERASGPVAGQRPVDQSSPRKLAAFQRIGVIPSKYTSWEQINDEFKYNVEVLGLSEQETRNKLNLNVKNSTGKYYFSKYERYGPGNYINFREISTDLQPEAVEDLLRINQRGGGLQGPRMASPQQQLEDAVFNEEDEWGDRPKNKHDPKIISSKERANATRDAIRARLGGPPKGSPSVYDSGKQIHRGHGFAASRSNAGLGSDNIWDELGSYNVYGHAGKSNNPRVHPDVLHESYAPPTAEFANWYRKIRDERLIPGIPDQLMMAADEYGSEIYGSRGSGRGKTYDVGPATTRGGPINTPEATVFAKADKLFQISSQIAEDRVDKDIKAGTVSFENTKEGKAARAAYTEKVRNAIAKTWLDQQSINLDPTSSPATPIEKSTYTFTQKDFTPLRWKEFEAGGGNAAIAQGKTVTEIIERGKAVRKDPNLMPSPKVIPSRFDKGIPAASKPQTPIPKQVRTQADIDRIFGSVGGPETIEVSGNYIPKPPIITTPTAKDRALAAERANAGKFKEMSRGPGPNLGMSLIPDPRPALKAVRENPRGAMAGVAVSALNPEVAQAVEQNNLGAAGNILARDVALGTLSEMGIKAALPLAGKYAPALARIGGVAGAAGTGAALFSQGQSGSLTDVLTRKAAQNPVSFMPAVQANPETDIGARASRAIANEVKYLSKQAKPLMKAIDNELRWLGKAGQRAFNNIFGKREI